jgi:hypothetical protein
MIQIGFRDVKEQSYGSRPSFYACPICSTDVDRGFLLWGLPVCTLDVSTFIKKASAFLYFASSLSRSQAQ